MDSTNFRPQRSASLWALALSAALVAIGFRRRDEAGASPERQDRRAAKTEADAPERGWFDVLERVYERFSEDRVMSIVGGVTFFVLLAIFPAIPHWSRSMVCSPTRRRSPVKSMSSRMSFRVELSK